MHQVPIRRSIVLRTVVPRRRKKTEIASARDGNHIYSHRYDFETAKERFT